MQPFSPPEPAESEAPSALRLSVVMATFNGSAHLPAQLRSLEVQELLPSELVCFDDASTDDTLDVLRDFAATAPFPVRIHTRTANVGPNRNFDEAIRLAAGDVVLCCDQDDAWSPTKLAEVAAAFDDRSDLGLVMNDARIADADLRVGEETLWQVWRLDHALQDRIRAGDAFRVFSQHVPPYGCTMAFRAALVPLVPPVPAGTTFDSWFGRMLAVVADVGLIPEPLQVYRQHAQQVTGFETRTMRGRLRALRRQAGIEVLRSALDRTAQAEQGLRSLDSTDERVGTATRWLQERDSFDRARLRIRSAGLAGLPMLVGLVRSGSYRTVSAGWRGAVVDLVGLLGRGFDRGASSTGPGSQPR